VPDRCLPQCQEPHLSAMKTLVVLTVHDGTNSAVMKAIIRLVAGLIFPYGANNMPICEGNPPE
jgi:hypothetical protein